MPLSDAELVLAEQCYGYGRWSAPYWFIGPEEGGTNKSVSKRADAFKRLNADGLCDCRAFHRAIHEQGDTDWFRTHPLTPLQTTWHCLIQTLMSYKGIVAYEKPKRGAALSDYQRPFRVYQRDHWGSFEGETCVIERSGLSAKSFSESAARRSELADKELHYLEELSEKRVKKITESIHTNSPELVIIYSKSKEDCWTRLRTDATPLARGEDEILKLNHTLIAFTKSPGRSAPGHARWLNLGRELRKHKSISVQN